MKKRICIVGAGPAGLIAANALAGKAEVYVVERLTEEDYIAGLKRSH